MRGDRESQEAYNCLICLNTRTWLQYGDGYMDGSEASLMLAKGLNFWLIVFLNF